MLPLNRSVDKPVVLSLSLPLVSPLLVVDVVVSTHINTKKETPPSKCERFPTLSVLHVRQFLLRAAQTCPCFREPLRSPFEATPSSRPVFRQLRSHHSVMSVDVRCQLKRLIERSHHDLAGRRIRKITSLGSTIIQPHHSHTNFTPFPANAAKAPDSSP